MGTTYEDYYNWKMPDGSTVVTRTPEAPEGYVPPSWEVLQGPQGPQGATGATGATGPRGLDALPAAFSAQYGWANPYMQTDAAYQPPPVPAAQSQAPPTTMQGQQRINPISLMSQYSGSSPSALMSMRAEQLRPQGPSWKMG